MEPGDICPDCAIVGVPGALCPKHAAADQLEDKYLKAMCRVSHLELVAKDLLGTVTICQQQRQFLKGERRRSWDLAFLDSEMVRSIAYANGNGIEWR